MNKNDAMFSRRMKNGKCYEVTFNYGWPFRVRKKVKIIEGPNVNSPYSVSYGVRFPSNSGWKPGWANYFQYIWDRGRVSSFSSCSDIVSFRSLVGIELKEMEMALRLGEVAQ